MNPKEESVMSDQFVRFGKGREHPFATDAHLKNIANEFEAQQPGGIKFSARVAPPEQNAGTPSSPPIEK